MTDLEAIEILGRILNRLPEWFDMTDEQFAAIERARDVLKEKVCG